MLKDFKETDKVNGSHGIGDSWVQGECADEDQLRCCNILGKR